MLAISGDAERTTPGFPASVTVAKVSGARDAATYEDPLGLYRNGDRVASPRSNAMDPGSAGRRLLHLPFAMSYRTATFESLRESPEG